MGIVQRQGIKSTIVSFVGVAVGAISMLFIYPLDDEFYGYIQYLYGISMFLVPFASLGVLSIIVKYYPHFKNEENGNNGFLSLLNVLLFAGLLIFFIILFVFNSTFYQGLELLNFNVKLIQENEFFIGALTIVLSFIMLFQLYAHSFQRIVVPGIIHPFLLKIFLPILLLLYYYSKVDLSQSTYVFIGFFIFVFALLVIYIRSQGQLNLTWNPSFVTKTLRKEMTQYGIYGSLNMIGNVLALRIDTIMITLLLGFKSNGQYLLIYFFAGILAIPLTSIIQIAGPLISQFHASNEISKISDIYKKSSVTLLAAGVLLFLLIWFTMDDIFQLSVDPSKFTYGKQIFLYLGLAKLVDMLTSVNSHIIVYSKYFRFNVLFILIMGVSNVFLNYFLIGEFSIVGAAMATCIALLLFNLIKLTFIYIKFDIHPFSIGIFKVVVIGLATFLIGYYLPDISNHIINILYKGSILSLVYIVAILNFSVSEEINVLYKKYIGTLKSFLKEKNNQ